MHPASELIQQEAIKKIIEKSLKSLNNDIFKITHPALKNAKKKFSQLYEVHYNEIYKWAFSIPFMGLSKPKQTDKSTIELIIASDIFKQTNDEEKRKISEAEILKSNQNILLIGAPGAGKTTTMKRLIVHYLNTVLTTDNYGFPILVRLRDLSPDTTLTKFILDIFDIKYEDKIVETEKKVIKGNIPSSFTTKTETTKKISTLVGDIPINLFLPKFLNQLKTLLLLDGLDEIEKSIQSDVFREIESLGLKLTDSKIILTVRKSELNKIVENFTFYDIAPLSEKQIQAISNRWLLKKSKNFLAELYSKPYKDLANRPIFLTLLMVLYEKNNILPTQPSEVYEDATYLIIKEWDEHRDILRQSKYADFNPRKKIKFLSEVSYLLTYKIKQKTFTSKELETIYYAIFPKYNLPKDEMKAVVSEIESHTGIIVESKYKSFEFSHLSIQEYLCANHFKDLPYSQETISYFIEYPETLAIAISISGEPSVWFSNLILSKFLNINNFKNITSKYIASMYSLLNRLLIESPSFKIMAELGFTFLYLSTNLYRYNSFPAVLDELFKYSSIKQSLSQALNECECLDNLNGFYSIKQTNPAKTEYYIDIPYRGELPAKFLNSLIHQRLIKISKERSIIHSN